MKEYIEPEVEIIEYLLGDIIAASTVPTTKTGADTEFGGGSGSGGGGEGGAPGGDAGVRDINFFFMSHFLSFRFLRVMIPDIFHKSPSFQKIFRMLLTDHVCTAAIINENTYFF